FAYENGGLPTNGRLAFLGDSVLGAVISTALFHNPPDLPEGQLAKLRASVVNPRAPAGVARALGPYAVVRYRLLGRCAVGTGRRRRPGGTGRRGPSGPPPRRRRRTRPSRVPPPRPAAAPPQRPPGKPASPPAGRPAGSRTGSRRQAPATTDPWRSTTRRRTA